MVLHDQLPKKFIYILAAIIERPFNPFSNQGVNGLMAGTDWVFERTRLATFIQQNPTWSTRRLARICGHSLSWVKIWCKIIRECRPNPELLARPEQSFVVPPTGQHAAAVCPQYYPQSGPRTA